MISSCCRTGQDTSSVVVKLDQVLNRALCTATIIYGVGLGLGRQPTNRPDGESGELILRRLAQQTAGRAFFAADARELARFYGRIRDELANQYSLAYETYRRFGWVLGTIVELGLSRMPLDRKGVPPPTGCATSIRARCDRDGIVSDDHWQRAAAADPP